MECDLDGGCEVQGMRYLDTRPIHLLDTARRMLKTRLGRRIRCLGGPTETKKVTLSDLNAGAKSSRSAS